MKNYKFICMLLCLCLALAILAGCVAAGAVKPNDSLENITENSERKTTANISEQSIENSMPDRSMEASEISCDNPSYEWDFQKGWPVFVFGFDKKGIIQFMYPDCEFPYGDAWWYYVTGALESAGEELLFHVELIDDLAEKEDSVYVIDTEQPKLGGLLQSLGIPYEIHQLENPRLAYKNGKEGYLYEAYHMNLSRADAVKLAEYMVEAGVREEDTLTNMFSFCHCGDLCGATNTASPEIPENWDALAWEFSPIFEENKE